MVLWKNYGTMEKKTMNGTIPKTIELRFTKEKNVDYQNKETFIYDGKT